MIKQPASSKGMKQKQQQKQPQPQPQRQKQNLLGKWGKGWSLYGALECISSEMHLSASETLDSAVVVIDRMTEAKGHFIWTQSGCARFHRISGLRIRLRGQLLARQFEKRRRHQGKTAVFAMDEGQFPPQVQAFDLQQASF